MNKASGGDGIPVELFQILKDDAVKVLHFICQQIECSTFTASSFRIWNSSSGIPSPPLALFVVILSKAHLTGNKESDTTE